jgi:hypothetical protein
MRTGALEVGADVPARREAINASCKYAKRSNSRSTGPAIMWALPRARHDIDRFELGSGDTSGQTGAKISGPTSRSVGSILRSQAFRAN